MTDKTFGAMSPAQFVKWLQDNPHVTAVGELVDPRPMPDAAREWLAADKAKLAAKFVALWELCGGPELWPEYQFDDIRRWRFDFCHPATKTAIEIDGGVWTQGRHTRGSGYLKDIEKYNAAQMSGFVVLRLGTGQVDMQHVSEFVEYVKQKEHECASY